MTTLYQEIKKMSIRLKVTHPFPTYSIEIRRII